MDAQEAIELAEIEQRLLAEFGAVVGADEVEHRLTLAVERFEDASIRTHLMLLIERRATADLRVAGASARAPETRTSETSSR